LGIRAAKDRCSSLIKKSTPLPATATKTFRPTSDRAVSIQVLQGESEKASENRRLAYIERPGFKPRVGTAYRISFIVTEDGLLTVEAELVDTGEKLETEIRPSSGLARSAVDKLREEFDQARAQRGKVKSSKDTKITFH
jgi:molecular chaperone DnaK (HSP70)